MQINLVYTIGFVRRILLGGVMIACSVAVSCFGGCNNENAQPAREDNPSPLTNSNTSSFPSGTNHQGRTTQTVSAVAMDFTQIALDYSLDTEETTVIRSKSEWQNYLNRAALRTDTHDGDPSIVECDFSEEMLIVHSFGRIDGYVFSEITVTRVVLEDSTIRVYLVVRGEAPQGDTMPDVISWPVVAVRLLRSNRLVAIFAEYQWHNL